MRFFTRLIALVPLVLSVASPGDAQTAQAVEADLKNANNKLTSLASLVEVPIITGAQVVDVSIAAKGLTTIVGQLTVHTQNSPTFRGADPQDIVTTLTATVSLITDTSIALVKAKPQFDKLKATQDVVVILTLLIKGVVISLQALYTKFPDGPAKAQLSEVQGVIGIQLGNVAEVYGV
ncbi:hypothetical protein K443DRAFT_13078 [Laccaria amethystina LaAM-08-1]|uniref:Uncharacterized protein n=1 Tax=Laccaria amethystina LaAM-08-1 TaxID=1095629 RepID=A0A0C9WQ22_9AGAR|nr:hypothetical protein K443DRAFT_13078 [Laccaria amethystina LaAM-08-1]